MFLHLTFNEPFQGQQVELLFQCHLLLGHCGRLYRRKNDFIVSGTLLEIDGIELLTMTARSDTDARCDGTQEVDLAAKKNDRTAMLIFIFRATEEGETSTLASIYHAAKTLTFVVAGDAKLLLFFLASTHFCFIGPL